MKYRNNLVITVVASCLIGLASCASVPEETVQLSVAVGKDIQQLYTGYRNTIRLSFEQMRQNGLAIIDERWTPVFLKEYIKGGMLVESAKAEQIERVEYWARTAVEDIDQKRKDFLQPLQKQEADLLADIDKAFGRTIRANAAITAHLMSIRKVKDTQNEALQAVGLEDVQEKISTGLASASDFTKKFTEDVEKQAKKLEESAQ